ncbi:MerR family transcriptional regulator [Nocardioides sp. Root151]|uniref:MerR family transcriptional regulator n=1 Tax=Nocardioides sp. Root151 TaxID=1736475 RepID=UPI000702665A|nr:MerR family transcriptional regulator [Nocardioides sp. Root151]KQZ70730.1 hypothetical protein ASD66_14240 [Nocardioides sp. Root151]
MLNIGDFARFAGVSVRMLRHYDAVGLLAPSEVDPFSGYRRYDESLLRRAHQLVALKELGFSLEVVGEMLDGPPDLLQQRLEQRRTELADEITANRTRLDEVERRLRLMEGHIMEMNCTETTLPELEVTQLTASVAEQPQIGPVIGPLFVRLASAAAGQGTGFDPSVAWYDVGDEGIRFAACGPAGLDVEGAEPATLPAVPRAVVATYTGPIDRIAEGWQALGAHLTEQGLHASGTCRELYLSSPADPSADWVIKLQQPVR